MMTTMKGSVKIDPGQEAHMAETVSELIRALLAKNGVEAADLRSVLLSATDDLPGGYSDAVIEGAALTGVPVYVVQQFRYQADMDRCVQVILYPKQKRASTVDLLLGCESWGEDS